MTDQAGTDQTDMGPVFDGVKIGRPATGALLTEGYRTMEDLPENLDELLPIHGVGPRAVRLLAEARGTRP
ncbi:helix-hairpin-helix domain-containing protein [Promicromonospora sp. NPDC050249]|uniref:helix-hairpin-helix domain-containing protein n=1 Tax=Promicromonospora sp. NPDC050249 TaxID=3154743 RepID=UPI0033FC5A32